MKSLDKKIYDYYLENFDQLPDDKRMHFASRMYLWTNDKASIQKLKEMQSDITCDGDFKKCLINIYDRSINTLKFESNNAGELREEYLIKYPQLRLINRILARITFMQTIYGIDATKYFFEIFDKKEIDKLYNQLLNDYRGIAVLSTHAVNFFYFYSLVILNDEDKIDPGLFINQISKQYDLSNINELQLYIYLYTHCIIGETKFYYRNIPQSKKEIYLDMVKKLENVIKNNYKDINMDNKFEFLVCCKILNYRSGLLNEIENETCDSLSSDGCYIIDKHNNNPQNHSSSFDTSEHRNVLYIMSNINFNPHQRLAF